MKTLLHRKKGILQSAALCTVLSSFILLVFPAHGPAAAWSPREEIVSFMHDNYPWKEIDIVSIHVKGQLSEEPPQRIVVEKGPLGKAVFSFFYPENTRYTVHAHVRALGHVVKTRRSFTKGHIIAEEDVYQAKMDIRKMPKSAVSDYSEIIGKPLKRSIRANTPVVEGMVQMAPVVARGKRVMLLIESQGMSISAVGVTKEKGQVGMPMRALNLSSRKEVSGVLVDEGTVKVKL